jgi:hypothetical protein
MSSSNHHRGRARSKPQSKIESGNQNGEAVAWLNVMP